MHQRVHADLFGPLKSAIGDKKYILSITDAFTKYAELKVILSKDATTVAKANYDDGSADLDVLFR